MAFEEFIDQFFTIKAEFDGNESELEAEAAKAAEAETETEDEIEELLKEFGF